MPSIDWLTALPPKLTAYRLLKTPMDMRLRYIRSRCGPEASLHVFAQQYVDLQRFNGCAYSNNLLTSMKKAFAAYGRCWDKEPTASIAMASAFARGEKIKLCHACEDDCFVSLSSPLKRSASAQAAKTEACEEAPSKRQRV